MTNIGEELKEVEVKEKVELSVLQKQIKINEQLEESIAALTHMVLIMANSSGENVKRALSQNQGFMNRMSLMMNNNKVTDDIRDQVKELHRIS